MLVNSLCEYAMVPLPSINNHYDRMLKQLEFSLVMAVGDINAFGKGLLDFKKIYDRVKQLVDLFGKAVSTWG